MTVHDRNKTQHQKMPFQMCLIEDSDQHVQLCSDQNLTWHIFYSQGCNVSYVDNENSDQTVQRHCLILYKGTARYCTKAQSDTVQRHILILYKGTF